LHYCMKALENATVNTTSQILQPYISFLPVITWDELAKDIEELFRYDFEYQTPDIVQTYLKTNQSINTQTAVCEFISSTGLAQLDFPHWEQIILNIDHSVLFQYPTLVKHSISETKAFNKKLDSVTYSNKLRSNYFSMMKSERNHAQLHQSWLEFSREKPSELVFGLNFAIEQGNGAIVEQYINLMIEKGDYSNVDKINYALIEKNRKHLSQRAVLILKLFEKIQTLKLICDLGKTQEITDETLYQIYEVFDPAQSQEIALLAFLMFDTLGIRIPSGNLTYQSLLAISLAYAGDLDKATDILFQYKLNKIWKSLMSKKETLEGKNNNLLQDDGFKSELSVIIRRLMKSWAK